MGVVGSLPLSASQPVLNNTIETENVNQILNEQTLPSSEEFDNDMMSVAYDIIPSNKLDEDIKNDVTKKNDVYNNTQASYDNQFPSKRYNIVSYGPISVRVHQCVVPTLKTGRRSKFAPLEGEAARKREERRKKNREVARKLKERRYNIERQLENEITELESKEKVLSEEICNLASYKQSLEEQFQENNFIKEEKIPPASPVLSTLLDIEPNQQQIQRTIFKYYEQKSTKTEPRSPSPQWQLHFSI